MEYISTPTRSLPKNHAVFCGVRRATPGFGEKTGPEKSEVFSRSGSILAGQVGPSLSILAGRAGSR